MARLTRDVEEKLRDEEEMQFIGVPEGPPVNIQLSYKKP